MAKEKKKEEEPKTPARDLKEMLLNDKEFGASKIRLAEDDMPFDMLHPVSSGIEILDIAMGGGLFLSRTYLLAAPESGGKTTLLDSFMRAWQQAGGIVVRMEYESTFDKVRSQLAGVDLGKLLIVPAGSLENGFKLCTVTCNKIRANFPDTPVLILWDTITSAATDKEIKAMSDPSEKSFQGGMMEEPRLIRQFLDDITPRLTHSKMTLVLVSQVYGGPDNYTPKDDPTHGYTIKGGMGPAHYSSATLFIMRDEAIYDSDKILIGWKGHINFAKNKQSPWSQPLKTVLYNDSGFNRWESLWENIRDKKLIREIGSGWWSYTIGKEERKFLSTKISEHFTDYPDAYDYFVYLFTRLMAIKFKTMAIRFHDRLKAAEDRFDIPEAERFVKTEVDPVLSIVNAGIGTSSNN